MALKMLAFLSMFPLIFLTATVLSFSTDPPGPYPIKLVVYNSVFKQENLTFITEIAYRGILIGAMNKVALKTSKFNFTTTENPDYGLFLVSINNVKGNPEDHTYWELLGQLQNGTIIRADVGIGCYIPSPNETVIFKFTKWSSEQLMWATAPREQCLGKVPCSQVP